MHGKKIQNAYHHKHRVLEHQLQPSRSRLVSVLCRRPHSGASGQKDADADAPWPTRGAAPSSATGGTAPAAAASGPSLSQSLRLLQSLLRPDPARCGSCQCPACECRVLRCGGDVRINVRLRGETRRRAGRSVGRSASDLTLAALVWGFVFFVPRLGADGASGARAGVCLLV